MLRMRSFRLLPVRSVISHFTQLMSVTTTRLKLAAARAEVERAEDAAGAARRPPTGDRDR